MVSPKDGFSLNVLIYLSVSYDLMFLDRFSKIKV